MRQRCDQLVAQTIQKMDTGIQSYSTNAQDQTNLQQDIEHLIQSALIEAFEKTEDAMEQTMLYHMFSMKFHPDKIQQLDTLNPQTKKFLKDKHLLNSPQQILEQVKNAKIERLPKFFSNTQEWLIVFIETLCNYLLIKFSCLFINDEDEIKEKENEIETARKKLSILSSPISFILSMSEGLDRYIQPFKFIANFISIFINIGLALGVIACLIPIGILYKTLGFIRGITTQLISLVSLMSYQKEIEQYKNQVLEAKKKELAELISKLSNKFDDTNFSSETLQAHIPNELVKEQIQEEIDSGSLIHLQCMFLSFYHSLTQDLSTKSGDYIAAFVISWPFRFLGALIIAPIAIAIEGLRWSCTALVGLTFFTALTIKVTALFVLNLPRYLFVEAPRAIIHKIRSIGSEPPEPSTGNEPLLLITDGLTSTSSENKNDNPNGSHSHRKLYYPEISADAASTTESSTMTLDKPN